MHNWRQRGLSSKFTESNHRWFHRVFKNRFDENMVYAPGEKMDFDSCYSSMITIKSDKINGLLAVNAKPEALKHSHPERKYGEDITEEDLVDWIGEIVNRVLGGIKIQLASFNIDPTLNPPESASKPYKENSSIKGKAETYVFRNGKYTVGVSFQADISNEVNFEKSAGDGSFE